MAYCFTKKGACADSKPIIPGLKVIKDGYDLSFDACRCANEEHGGCKCAGVQDGRGFGGNACNSSLDKREPAWCYVKEGSCCDGRPSEEQMPGMDFSNDACACKSTAKCRCQIRGWQNAIRFNSHLKGHGMCNSLMAPGEGEQPRPWCFTYPGDCCDGMPKKVGPFLYHISFEACHGKLMKHPPRLGPMTRPRPPANDDNHAWIFGLLFVVLAASGAIGFWVYTKRRRMVASSGGAAGGGSATPAASRAARHAPPPATYGALSSSRVRVDWPENAALHGKMMWASTYNEQTDTYICKTHEPGPNGVKPFSVKTDKLVAEVE